MGTQAFAENLEKSIEAYYKQIWETPDAKNDPIDFDDSIPESDPSSILRELSGINRNAFARFAFAKHALALALRAECLISLNDLIPQWLHFCVEVGAYRDCVDFANSCINSSAWNNEIPIRARISVLLNCAKAHRNLGEFNEAQESYRELIDLADEAGDRVGTSAGLVLIGKLYGNYLNQRSLFSSFVEEARLRLEDERHNFLGPEVEYQRIIHWLSICYDALGQAYRLDKPTELDGHFIKEREIVEKQFTRALELNRSINRESGISRAICHLNYFKFRYATPSEDSISYLNEFREGMKLLRGKQPDDRGLGIRFTQYASMLHKLNRLEEAKEYLGAGKNFAIRYSDYKTITRAALVESEIYKISDPGRAIRALKHARLVAIDYELPVQEGEINRSLAELSSGGSSVSQSDPDLQLHKLFNRNRSIYVKFISEVKSNLLQLETRSDSKPEFKRLSAESKKSFREKLWIDFDQAVSQLNLNIEALTTELSINMRQRQELVFFDLLNSFALLLLHDYKATILDENKITPLQEVGKRLNELAYHLTSIKKSAQYNGNEEEKMDEIIESLIEESEQATALSQELGELKKHLSERLRQPDLEALEEKISLIEICERAIDELRQQNTQAAELIKFPTPVCDIKLYFNNDIMVRVIQNLIRNALDELSDGRVTDEVIMVSLKSELSGNPALQNPARAAVLSVITIFHDEERAKKAAASIQNGLDKRASDKRYGSGVGLRMAKLVFKEFFGADIQVCVNKAGAGIRVAFKLDHGNVEIVSNQ